MQKNNKTQKAFSLIELSAVLIIIAVLILLSVPTISEINKNAKIKITNDRMKALYQALGSFAQSQNRLPCPASILLAKSDSNYGKEVACGTTPLETPAASSGVFQCVWSNNVIYGMIPTQTLGLPADMAEDGFGNKLAYVVIRGYTNPSTFGTNDPSTYIYNSYSGSTYAWQTCNRIFVYEKKGSNYNQITSTDSSYTGNGLGSCVSYPNNSQAIFVIISNGANKLGAFPATGTSQDTASFSNASFPTWDSDEGANMLRIDSMSWSYTGPTGYFFNYGDCGSGCFGYTFVAASDGNDFDDILLYKSINQLSLDFNLKDAVTCSTSTSQTITYTSGTTFYWDGSASPILNTKQNNIVAASTTDCPSGYTKRATRPTKRCGRFGLWDPGIIEPCKN